MGKWIKNNMLFVAIVMGALGTNIFRYAHPFLPILIFLMLFFTFCKVNPLDLRLHRWHFIALAIQLLLATIAYVGVIGLSHWLGGDDSMWQMMAQAFMLCFLMPTATAAPIIAGKLGGSIQNLTTYTLLTNMVTALLVPLFFPMIHPMPDLTFWSAVGRILSKVGPLLLGSFFAAWLLRLIYNAIQRHRYRHSPLPSPTFHLSPTLAQFPFYIWVVSIMILMADMTYSLLHEHYSGWILLGILLTTFISCFLQFFLGHRIGWRFPAPSHGTDYQDVVINPQSAPTTPEGISRITVGQALGQKNTALAIWIAQTYLMPLAALGPSLYMIIQNLYNSYQLNRAAKNF